MNDKEKEKAISEVQNAIDAMINLLEDHNLPAAEKVLATAALRTLRSLESGISVS
jgi:hypothetical protein